MKKYFYSFCIFFFLLGFTSKVQALTIFINSIPEDKSDIGDTVYNNENITICRSSLPYFYSNNLYSTEGTYKIYLKTKEGKDSVITLHLNVLDIPKRPDEINGDTLINEIGSYIYKIDSVEDATEYTWFISNLNWTTNKSTKDTTKLFIPTGGIGVLSVTAKNICGISASSQLTIQSGLNIVDNKANVNLSIYPNPTDDIVCVYIPSKQGYTINIYDVFGRKVKTVTSTNSMIEFSILELSSGIYILRINNHQNETIITTKISKH